MSSPQLQPEEFATPAADKLDDIVAMMREISRQSDPVEIFREYATRVRRIYPVDRVLLLRRSLSGDESIQATVIDDWEAPVHPWADSDRFQTITGGMLVSIFERGEATIINELEIDDDDNGRDYLADMRSLRAIPLFEQGEASQMIIGLKTEPQGFFEKDLPALVWLSNLFGRSIQNLLLAQKLKAAYQSVDRELKVIGEIQRSLLPERIPQVPGLELAAYYQASHRAGGDYYDFFPLPDGKLGILIADVSGHGTPAAVVMAIIHSIAHTYIGSHDPPSTFLNYLNRNVTDRYTAHSGTFVTAFYGVYDPRTGNFKYSSAGHNPPIRRRCGASDVTMLDKAGRLPLGISKEITYDDAEELLYPGDRVVLYTDGIIEATSPMDELFGTRRLGELISNCDLNTTTIVDSVVETLERFTQTSTLGDDRTMVVMKLQASMGHPLYGL
ncbi:MAG: SpoIIE family protein phosphatase [Planctomycetaceae bacterium]|nr:SpoIIE family protein phosphatase [Planctomycetaceae bacterium]